MQRNLKARVFEQPFMESDVNPANLWWQEWQTLQQQHHQFLTQQTELHQQFLNWNTRMTQLLLSQDPVTFTEAVPLFDSGSQSQQTTSLEPIQNAQPPMSPPASISSTQTTKVSTPSKYHLPLIICCLTMWHPMHQKPTDLH